MRLSLNEIAALGVPEARATSAPGPEDLVAVIDIDHDAHELAAAIRATNRITIGVMSTSAEMVDPCDVSVSSGDELQLLIDAITASPRAAYTLVHTLRATALLPVPESLVVESAAFSLLLGGPEFARWLANQPRRQAPPAERATRLTRDDGTLRIVLARPERRNAFSAAMRDEIVEALALALADESITKVELTGEGPCFSSGGDLVEFGTTPDTASAHLVRTLQSPARLLAAVSARVSAYVHGPCVGAGVELPSFAGQVIAAPGTTFTLPELRMGLIPGAGGTVGITRRIGRQRTAWLALTSATLDVATALAWGLVDEIGELH
jgi:hypothetical protein